MTPLDNDLSNLDTLIGKRIRFRRNLIGMTQEDLAKQLSISFQQVQKYETGKNKISAARLYHIAKILRTPISAFFEEDATNISGLSDNAQDGFEHTDTFDATETAKLIKSYYEIEDKKKRRNVLDMMKALSSV